MTSHDERDDGGFGDEGPGGDELDLLREAWAGAAPPVATPKLDDADPLTRATVAWSRDAWEQLEAPAARMPLALHVATRFASLRRAPWPRYAAAAVVLIALMLGRSLRPTDGERAPLNETTASNGADTSPASTSQGTSHTPAALPERRVVAVADDHIELRSGPVRLLLMTAAQPSER